MFGEQLFDPERIDVVLDLVDTAGDEGCNELVTT